jgi:Tfp pilus assembly protein PilF
MSRNARRIAVFSAFTTVLLSSSAAGAQTMDADTFYSQGVHAYFSGQSAAAERSLSTALAINPNDPRSYYFRALCELRQGRADEARSDMQMGAALEAQSPNRFAVGAALERVQGGNRLLLEQYRRDGRMSEASLRAQRDLKRYEQVRQREPDVLHQKATIPLDSLLGANGTRPVVVLERSPRPRTSLPTASAPAPIGAAAPADDPFHDDPTSPAQRTAPVNPAVAQPAAPAAGRAPVVTTQPQAPTKGAFDDTNPFGDVMPTGPAQSTPAPPAGLPTTPTTPDNDNPFRAP